MTSRESLHQTFETWEGEYLKNTAELALHSLARYRAGASVLRLIRGGERIEDPRLYVHMAGMHFENPVMMGAGWDKKGRCVDGLYALNFAGTEVGTVLPYRQAGTPKPRLFYKDGTGLNRMGFNSPGKDVVDENLGSQNLFGIVGISVGKNKIMPREHESWAHAVTIEHLKDYADYFALGVSSPNTPGLRDQMKRGPLTEIVQASKEAAVGIPLFVKITIDLALEDLDTVLEVCIENDVDGVIDTNTTIDEAIKQKYDWQGQMGGVSGDDPDYRNKATERMKHITRETRGTDLQRIGVGGINDADTALERIKAGAQVVQLVTAIRQRKGRVARDINLGLLEAMDRDGVSSISEYVGVDA